MEGRELGAKEADGHSLGRLVGTPEMEGLSDGPELGKLVGE